MPAMLFVVSTNSIFKERIPDETFFLHGLGTGCPLLARSPICTFTLALQNFWYFSPIQKKAIRKLKKVDGAPPARKRTFILVGLSLGGVLALDLSRQDFRNSRAWSLQELNTNQHQSPLSAPDPSLSSTSKHVFEKQDANKQQMLQIWPN